MSTNCAQSDLLVRLSLQTNMQNVHCWDNAETFISNIKSHWPGNMFKIFVSALSCLEHQVLSYALVQAQNMLTLSGTISKLYLHKPAGLILNVVFTILQLYNGHMTPRRRHGSQNTRQTFIKRVKIAQKVSSCLWFSISICFMGWQ